MEAIGNRGELDLSIKRPLEEVQAGYSRFHDGDVVIAKITPCFENGKGALIRGTTAGVGYGTTELHVLAPGRDLDGRFLYYLTVQSEFRRLGASYMTGSAGQQRVPENFVRDFRVSVPPLSTQHDIADYLDRETARIDALIAAKERVLALLAERRAALITRAVTRGLDPDAPLRSFGAPWLEEIPAHWETWKLGHLGRVGNGSTPSRGNGRYWTDGTIPWLNSGVVNRDEVTFSEQHVTHAALDECHLPLLSPGTVLIAIIGQGKTRGLAAVLSVEATVNQNLGFIDPDRELLNPWFLRWWLSATYPFLRSMSDDARGPKGVLTCEDVANLRIALPPVRDQMAIVDHIARETEKLKAAGDTTQRTIELLRERRVALISAAVTGQIDVEAAS